MALLIKIWEHLSEMKNWEKLWAIILLIPFIYFMISFFVYYPGEPSMLIEKTLFETSDIYLNVSKGYEYHIMLDPKLSDTAPKKLMVTITQNSVVLKRYTSKLDCVIIEYSCWYKYEPKSAAFIPKQDGETKISINILEKGQNNRYFVKIYVYEGGETGSYRTGYSFVFVYLFFFVAFTLALIIVSSQDHKWSTSAKILAIECAIILITLIFTYYVIDPRLRL